MLSRDSNRICSQSLAKGNLESPQQIGSFFGRLGNLTENVAVGYRGNHQSQEVGVFAFIVERTAPVGNLNLDSLGFELERTFRRELPQFRDYVITTDGSKVYADIHCSLVGK
ncbi:MAG: hypothetical protein KDD64_06565 [Bdellovibrionales bacterium]|nr:hypothetical protein [Bdellovibrionales bacterium]